MRVIQNGECFVFFRFLLSVILFFVAFCFYTCSNVYLTASMWDICLLLNREKETTSKRKATSQSDSWTKPNPWIVFFFSCFVIRLYFLFYVISFVCVHRLVGICKGNLHNFTLKIKMYSHCVLCNVFLQIDFVCFLHLGICPGFSRSKLSHFAWPWVFMRSSYIFIRIQRVPPAWAKKESNPKSEIEAAVAFFTLKPRRKLIGPQSK